LRKTTGVSVSAAKSCGRRKRLYMLEDYPFNG
jgi:hypothetical protein